MEWVLILAFGIVFVGFLFIVREALSSHDTHAKK